MIQPTVSSHIDVHLIEASLALTWRTMEDMEIDKKDVWWKIVNWLLIKKYKGNFSIEKFWWYLLSYEFIEEYYYTADKSSEWYWQWEMPNIFWTAIYEYQSGNSEPLVNLLSKI